MFSSDRRSRDAFTLSLGGVTTIASFAIAPAIAHDLFRRARAQRPPAADHPAGEAHDRRRCDDPSHPACAPAGTG